MSLLVTVLGSFLAVRGYLFFPRLLLFGIRLFRGIVNTVGSAFGDPHLADHAGISAINAINIKHFLKTPKPILILPQCLRSVDCPAHIDPRIGIVCAGCNRCVIGRLIREHPDLKVFVTPGGTFAVRVVKQEKPRSVLGIACANDLYEGMLYCHLNKIAVYGIELLRDGCVETAVDEESVFNLLKSIEGVKENTAERS